MDIYSIDRVQTNSYAQQQTAQTKAIEELAEQQSVVQQSAAADLVNTESAAGETSAAAAAAQELAQGLSSGDETTNTILLSKANSGLELTATELSELQDLDPVLYAQAVKAQQKREALREEMMQSPSAANQIARNAIAQEQGNGEKITRMAMADEFIQFAGRYDQVELGN